MSEADDKAKTALGKTVQQTDGRTESVIRAARLQLQTRVSVSPKSDPKLKSREVSFLLNFLRNCPIVLKFCTEHGSVTILCAVQNIKTGTKVMKKRDFTRFEFRIEFRTDSLYCTETLVRPPVCYMF